MQARGSGIEELFRNSGLKVWVGPAEATFDVGADFPIQEGDIGFFRKRVVGNAVELFDVFQYGAG